MKVNEGFALFRTYVDAAKGSRLQSFFMESIDMMKPVKITIRSQSIGREGTEDIETVAAGRMTEKNNKFYAFYEESEASGMAGTKTTIKWDYDRVIILRGGTVDCRQEFALGLVNESIYQTPYLTLPMRLVTEYLDVCCRDKVWHIELEYALEICGEPHSKMKLKLEIEEDLEREYEGSTGCCH